VRANRLEKCSDAAMVRPRARARSKKTANLTARRLSPNDPAASCERDESSYCGCGYTGPLCSKCGGASDGERYYLSWETQFCASCGDSGSHAPTISLLGSLGAFVVLAQ
jgi:hypothetical protein